MQNRIKTLRHFRDLEVYRLAFQHAMAIYQLTNNVLDSEYEKIIAMLNSMEKKSDAFCF